MFGNVTQDEEIGRNVNHAPSIGRKDAPIALIRGTTPL